jgi:hypothetical protein
VICAVGPDQPEKAQACALRGFYCKVSGSPGAGHDRQACHGSFLHDLKRDPSRDLQDAHFLKRIFTREQFRAKDFVDGVVPADVFGETEHRAICREKACTVASGRFAMRLLRLAQRGIRTGKEVRDKFDRRAWHPSRQLALEFFNGACPAKSTGTADGQQAAPFRFKHNTWSERDIPNIGLVSLSRRIATRLNRQEILWPAQQTLGSEEARDQLAFLPGHAKQHSQGLAADSQFKRLFDCDPVFASVDHNARGPCRKARDMHGTGERGR